MQALDELEKIIRDKLTETDEQLTRGLPESFPSYRELVGIRKGVEHCLVELVELRKKRNDEEEQ